MAILGRGIPRKAGRYELLTQIGAGGEGVVYLGRSSGIGGFEREVAIKVVHPGRTESTAGLLEEGTLAARIRHPNVVPVFDVGEDEDGVFLVMDYVEGDSLAGLLKAAGGEMPTRIALRILADALAGLHAAHELCAADGEPLNLVHRDFSPHNILVGVDGVARLTDFGIAKATSRSSVTKTGVFKGKIGYVSPENLAGMPLDRRSDIWSAGIVAWELLAERRIYAGLEDMATMMRIANEPPPRLRSVRPDIALALDEVIAAALSPAAKRLASADELRRQLLDAFGMPLADPAEVGEHVRMVAGPMLERRRRDAAEPTGSSRSGVRSTAATLSEYATTTVRMAEPSSAPRSRRRGWVIGTAIASSLAVGIALLSATRGARTETKSPVTAASAPAAEVAAPLIAAPSADPSEPPAPTAVASSAPATPIRPRTKRPPMPGVASHRPGGLDMAPSPYEKPR